MKRAKRKKKKKEREEGKGGKGIAFSLRKIRLLIEILALECCPDYCCSNYSKKKIIGNTGEREEMHEGTRSSNFIVPSVLIPQRN